MLSLFKCLSPWPHTFKGHLVAISRSDTRSFHSHQAYFSFLTQGFILSKKEDHLLVLLILLQMSWNWQKERPSLTTHSSQFSYVSIFNITRDICPWGTQLVSSKRKKVMDRRLKQVWKCLAAKETQKLLETAIRNVGSLHSLLACIKMAEFSIYWQD